MCRQTDKPNSLPVSPISLVKAIQGGQIEAKSLPKEHRQICVDYLTNEGYSSGEISEILKVSPRTIRRDRERIRQDNAVNLDADFTGRHVGLLTQRSQHAIENLIRVSKEKGCPHFVKVKAIKETWLITRGLAQLLQSVGYLPNRTLPISSKLTDETYELPDLEDLTSQLATLKTSFEQAGKTNEDIAQNITDLEDVVSRLCISNRIKHVQSKIVGAEEDDST